jgi:hypothetical protein
MQRSQPSRIVNEWQCNRGNTAKRNAANLALKLPVLNGEQPTSRFQFIVLGLHDCHILLVHAVLLRKLVFHREEASVEVVDDDLLLLPPAQAVPTTQEEQMSQRV